MVPDLIVVAGGLAQRPFYAGHAWQFLEYLLGLKDLGFEVLFLDRLEPDMCTDASGNRVPVEESVQWSYFLRVMRQFGLEGQYSILFNQGEEYLGASESHVHEAMGRCLFLLNVMGFLTDERLLAAAPRRVFLDTDPGMGQLWQALGLHDLFAGHDDFVTIGENIGRPDCEIPTCGRDWITMRQPVVLDLWPVTISADAKAITSVVSWRGPFGPLEYHGKTYGLRVHEFRRFAELPTLVDNAFHLALDIDPVETKDIEMLKANHWKLVNPQAVAAEPLQYQQFIQRSRAEFMVAKNIYVETRGGWFSDRSTCYLASGKPVVAQDTAIEQIYPTGEGLIAFRTLDEARAAVDAINADYVRHSEAARGIAETYFNSRKVFGHLLSELGI